MNSEWKKKFDALRQKCLACRACPLGGVEVEPGHFANVFSSFDEEKYKNIMVVGQNPGHDEVLQGVPFVGASGRFFNTAI
jgi:uracil-DNA glycosylase family 4